jgi:N-acylneuraminate cytidylyltransferase
VSVALYPYPIQRALAIREGSETIGMIEKENFLKRSQDLPVCYHDAGQFIIGKTVSWRKNTPLVSGETFPIVIPRLRVQDIDDEEDWLEAEAKFALLEDYRVCKN